MCLSPPGFAILSCCSLALCLFYLMASPITLASASKCGGREAIVASSRPPNISYLSLGSVTEAMKLATSMASACLYGGY